MSCWNSFVLYPAPLVLYVWAVLLGFWPIVEFVKWSWTRNTSSQLLSLHNVPPLLLIVLIVFVARHFSWWFQEHRDVLCPLFIQGKLKQNTQLFTGNALFHIQAIPHSLLLLGTLLLNQNILGLNVLLKSTLTEVLWSHFPQPHFSSCSRDLN